MCIYLNNIANKLCLQSIMVTMHHIATSDILRLSRNYLSMNKVKTWDFSDVIYLNVSKHAHARILDETLISQCVYISKLKPMYSFGKW